MKIHRSIKIIIGILIMWMGFIMTYFENTPKGISYIIWGIGIGMQIASYSIKDFK